MSLRLLALRPALGMSCDVSARASPDANAVNVNAIKQGSWVDKNLEYRRCKAVTSMGMLCKLAAKKGKFYDGQNIVSGIVRGQLINMSSAAPGHQGVRRSLQVFVDWQDEAA